MTSRLAHAARLVRAWCTHAAGFVAALVLCCFLSITCHDYFPFDLNRSVSGAKKRMRRRFRLAALALFRFDGAAPDVGRLALDLRGLLLPPMLIT